LYAVQITLAGVLRVFLGLFLFGIALTRVVDGLKAIVKAVAINDREIEKKIFGEADYASEREHVAGRM